MSDPALRVEGVSRSFGRIRALREVSFEVGRQSIHGLLGPNGAGKTTLFSIAASFIRADAGRVEVLGIDAREISRLRGRLSILPQDALFQRNVPILEQLTFFLMLEGRSRSDARAEVERTLERVGLGGYAKRRVHSLSHGMIKRLGVAQAFLGEPEVILLDEATSGLDPRNARQIRDLIRELRERATVVVSSHNLAEIQELCDHVAILDRGRLVAAASVAEITRSGKELDLRLSRPLLEEERREIEGVRGVAGIRDLGPSRYGVSVEPPEGGTETDGVTAEVLRRLLDRGVTPRELREGSTLEEHFLRLTGK